MNLVFGASGHAREIEYLLREFSGDKKIVNFFIADISGNPLKNISVLSEAELIEVLREDTSVANSYIAIGNGNIRKKIVCFFTENNRLKFPNLISNSVIGDFTNIKLGEGNIFFPSVILTTDISIGNHNHFNLNTSISHDCTIGNYNTFSPGVVIAGNVTLGDHNFFGLGCNVIDNVTITENVVIGAGSVVTKSILNSGTYVGIPAKKIK